MRLALAGAVLALCPLAAVAQTELTALSLETRTYDSLVNWRERASRPSGAEEVIRNEGMVIVDLRAVLDVPWSDDLSRVSARASDMVLELADGTVIEPFGQMDYLSKATTLSSGLSASRPSGYPDEDKHAYFTGLYMVPAGTSEATFRIGGDDVAFSQQVQIAAPAEMEPLAAFAGFAVQDPRLIRVLGLEDGSGSKLFRSSITAPAGYVFADVEIAVSGLQANDFDTPDRFYWYTTDFRLVSDAFGDMPMIGERFMRQILDWQFNSVAVGESATRRVIFMVPEGMPGATLYYGSEPVAEVALGGLAVVDEG